MSISEFVSRYNLHDSLLEEISHDNGMITLTVDFCYWQQKNYKATDPETGVVHINFPEGKIHDYIPHEINSDEIIACKAIDDNTLLLEVANDISGTCHTIKISALSVTFSTE